MVLHNNYYINRSLVFLYRPYQRSKAALKNEKPVYTVYILDFRHFGALRIFPYWRECSVAKPEPGRNRIIILARAGAASTCVTYYFWTILKKIGQLKLTVKAWKKLTKHQHNIVFEYCAVSTKSVLYFSVGKIRLSTI
jgi:hypothetical protein